MEPIRRADLEPLERIDEGGFGRVFRVGTFRLPGDPAPLAFKEFTKAHDDQAAAAKAAVAFWAARSPDEQAVLSQHAVWPRALVEEPPGTVCGLLMHLLPDEFFCQMIDPETDRPAPTLRNMKWLVARRTTLRRSDIDLPEIGYEQRLFLMAQLTYAIGWLHRRGWVFGDLSFNNAAFALDPLRIMLIDCDGAAALANPARKQNSTPFWEPPESKAPPDLRLELQDRETDTYKMGLAIMRCLTPGQGAATSRSPARLREDDLDAEGIDLITRALSADRASRPTTKDLYSYLRRVTQPLVAIPEVIYVKLATPFRLRSQPVRIDWKMDRAETITISTDRGFSKTFRYAANPDSCSFTLDESGLMSVVVGNEYGTVSLSLGEVTVYDLPPFHVDLNHLPDPRIPEVESFSTEPLAIRLTASPGAELTFPALPDIQSPRALGLIPDLGPEFPVPAPWPGLSDVVMDVTEEIRELILTEAARVAEGQPDARPGMGDDDAPR